MLEFPSSQKQNLAPCLQFVYTFILLITYIFLIFNFEHEIRAKPIFSLGTHSKALIYLYNLHHCSAPRTPPGRAMCLHQLVSCFALKYCPWCPGIEKNRSYIEILDTGLSIHSNFRTENMDLVKRNQIKRRKCCIFRHCSADSKQRKIKY